MLYRETQYLLCLDKTYQGFLRWEQLLQLILGAQTCSFPITHCSDPTCWGRNYILKWVFFVQSILADRYVHREI